MLFEKYLKTMVRPRVSKHYNYFRNYYLDHAMDESDLLQDVSIKIWQTYEKNKDRIKGDDLSKFINVSLKNILHCQKTRLLNPKKSHNLKYKLSLEQLIEEGVDFEVNLFNPEIFIDSLSNVLSRREVKLLKQKFVKSKTYKEIATSLKMSERYVFVLYHKILKKLRALKF